MNKKLIKTNLLCQTSFDVDSVIIYFTDEQIKRLKDILAYIKEISEIDSVSLGDFLEVSWLYDNKETTERISNEDLVLFKDGDIVYQGYEKYTNKLIESNFISINTL